MLYRGIFLGCGRFGTMLFDIGGWLCDDEGSDRFAARCLTG